MQVNVGQHLGMIIGIHKTDMVKSDIAFNIFQLFGARRVHNFQRLVHNFDKTLDTCHAPLKLLGKLNDPADRGEQCRDVEQVSHQVTRRDLSVNHKQ